MKLKCVIIDDEPIARAGLQEYVAAVDFLELLAQFSDPLQACNLLQQGHIDLLFLDVRMPRISGIDFLRSLTHPPLTILTTAYPDYALQGYELNLADYLLKPFSFERFLKAVNRARQLVEHNDSPATAGSESHFFIKVDGKLLRLAFAEVLYAEALQNYVAFYTDTRKYVCYLTMKAVEETLTDPLFIRVHKSYVVAADKVEAIEGNELIIGSHRIPVSRGSRDAVLEKILRNRLLRR